MPLAPSPSPTPTLWTLPIPSESSSPLPSFAPSPSPTKQHDSIWRVDYNAMVERDAALGWEGLGYVLLLNTIMFTIAFVIFQTCARSTRFSLFGFRTSSTSPPPARFTLQKWAKLLWKTPIQGTDIETRLGPEGTFYLVYQVYALRFLLALSVYAVCVLIPLYLSVNAGLLPHTGANDSSNGTAVDVGTATNLTASTKLYNDAVEDASDRNATTNKWWSFAHTTIRTLPNDSPYLWIPVVTCYLFTFAFLFFFHHVSSLASIPKGNESHHHHSVKNRERERPRSAPSKQAKPPAKPPRTPVKKAQEPAQQTEELPVSSPPPSSSTSSSIALLPLPSDISSTNSSVYTSNSTQYTNSTSSDPTAVAIADDKLTPTPPPSNTPTPTPPTSNQPAPAPVQSRLLATKRLAGMQPSELSLRSLFVDRYFPKHLREERLLFLLHEVFPGYVDDVCVVYNLSSFFWYQSTRERKEARFERDSLLHSHPEFTSWSLRLLPGSMKFPFVHRVLETWCCCACIRAPTKFDADADLARIHTLKQAEEAALTRVVQDVHGAGRAFLVFKSARLRARFVRRVRNASVASILANFPDADIPKLKRYVRELGLTRWHLSAAPEPDDIDWLSVSFPIVQRTAAVILVNVAILALLFTFTSPLAVTSAIASSSSVVSGPAKSLSDFVASVSDMVENFSPQMAKMMTAYIPTLILVVINAVLLNVLQIAGRIQPIATDSAKERNILRTSAVYLLFNTLFVPSLAFVSIDAVLLYLETDGQVLDMLGTLFLHNSGVFYVNYVLQRCFLGTAVNLLRVSEVAKFAWEKPRAVTPQEHVQAVEAWPFFTGTASALQISMLAVVMTFSTVVPLIVPIGALYFAMQHAVDKYALLFVRPRIKGRGSIARTATHATMLSLLIYLSAMSGFFLVRGTKMQSSSVLVLLMGTYIVSLWWYIGDKERAYGQTRKGHHVHGPQCKHKNREEQIEKSRQRVAQVARLASAMSSSMRMTTTKPPDETTALLPRVREQDLEAGGFNGEDTTVRQRRRSSVVGGGNGGSEESDLYRAPALRRYGKNSSSVRAAVELARRTSLYGTWHGGSQSLHDFGSARGSAPHTPVPRPS